MPTVLWWGRFDPDYSRNRIVRQYFRELGWSIVDYRPLASPLGHWQAALAGLPKVDLVWVPCFRQRDITAARRWSRKHKLPLVADPLISAYDKQVFEHGKHARNSPRAERLRIWEGRLLKSADLLIADTPAHAEYFSNTFDIPADSVSVVHVGAEEPLFHPAPMRPYDGRRPLELLFFGSFIGLQGPEFIIEAARLYRGPAVRWTLLGDGPLRKICEKKAQGLDNVIFEDWLPYTELPDRIHRADILLGIFGTTPKAGRVIPNKVFQALACGRPVITRAAPAYPAELRTASGNGIIWVEPGNARSLAENLALVAENPAMLATLGQRAAETYQSFFARSIIMAHFADAISKAVSRGVQGME